MKLFSKNLILRLSAVLFIVLLLAAIRFFEATLFYDPLLLYFKSNFQNTPLPTINHSLLFTSYIWRYTLNSTLSLIILYLCLQDRSMIRFSCWMYLILLFILLFLFGSALYLFDEPDKMLVFYLRRLIIQPLFLLLFLAGFLYQNHTKPIKK